MYLTMIFALSNAAGRLAVGFAADPLNKAVSWAPLSFWFVCGAIANVLLFTGFSLGIAGSTNSKDDLESPPVFLMFMTFLTAFTYGGVFTINTSFMKTIVPPSKVGLILGVSLMLLAAGSFAWLTISKEITKHWQADFVDVKAEDVGENLKKPFFIMATIMSAVALVPAVLVYLSQLKEKAESEEAKKGQDLESTEDGCESTEE
jgi:MFS family permease